MFASTQLLLGKVGKHNRW